MIIQEDGINYYDCCICGSFNEAFSRCKCRLSEEEKQLSKIIGMFRNKNNSFSFGRSGEQK